MNLLAPVKTIMTSDLLTVSENDPLSRLKEIFEAHRFHHVPVTNGEELVGMISKTDFLFFTKGYLKSKIGQDFENIRLNTHEVKEIMTTGVATLDVNDKVNVALEVFKENLFHALPILEEGKLAGIVTTFDIIKNLAEGKGAINEYIQK